jgi:hypothetical protein
MILVDNDSFCTKSIRAPIYSLKFNVVGQPGLSTTTTSKFSVLPNQLFQVESFSPMLNVEEGNTDFGWFPDINIHDGALEKKPSDYTFGCVNRPLRLFAKSTLKRVTTAKVTWTFAINNSFTADPPVGAETLGAGAFVTQGGDGPAYKNGGGQSVGQLAHDLDGTTAITEIVVLANVGVVFDENIPLKLWKYNSNNVLPEQRSQEWQEIPASVIRSAPILAFVDAVREIGLYDTCWWYSLCNFQYRQHYEHTCSDHLDC